MEEHEEKMIAASSHFGETLKEKIRCFLVQQLDRSAILAEVREFVKDSEKQECIDSTKLVQLIRTQMEKQIFSALTMPIIPFSSPSPKREIVLPDLEDNTINPIWVDGKDCVSGMMLPDVEENTVNPIWVDGKDSASETVGKSHLYEHEENVKERGSEAVSPNLKEKAQNLFWVHAKDSGSVSLTQLVGVFAKSCIISRVESCSAESVTPSEKFENVEVCLSDFAVTMGIYLPFFEDQFVVVLKANMVIFFSTYDPGGSRHMVLPLQERMYIHLFLALVALAF